MRRGIRPHGDGQHRPGCCTTVHRRVNRRGFRPQRARSAAPCEALSCRPVGASKMPSRIARSIGKLAVRRWSCHWAAGISHSPRGISRSKATVMIRHGVREVGMNHSQGRGTPMVQTTTFRIGGMSCGACVRQVTRANTMEEDVVCGMQVDPAKAAHRTTSSHRPDPPVSQRFDLSWMPVYTRESVGTLIRPLAVCVVLLFGAGPVATLACELACSTPNGHADHQASHHDHDSQGVHASDSTGETPSLRPPTSTCDHAIAVAPAVTSIAMKVFAPAAIPALKLAAPERGPADPMPVRHLSGGPPGPRSGPVSLRI